MAPEIDLLRFERELYEKGFKYIAGLDEVGRGALAGPVVAAAVIFPSNTLIPGVDDSKKLSAQRRNNLFESIQRKAVSIGIGLIRAQTIDEINILEATKSAMKKAVFRCKTAPDFLLVDALTIPGTTIPQKKIIKGDQKSHSIAAASIIAKVIRDRIMICRDKSFPGYHFAKNKGYGTADHIRALQRFGPCNIHRKTFKHVYDWKKLFAM